MTQSVTKIESKWVNEQQVLEWLGCSRQFMNQFAKQKKINYSYLGQNRIKMYDLTSIEKVLEENSLQKYIEEVTGQPAV